MLVSPMKTQYQLNFIKAWIITLSLSITFGIILTDKPKPALFIATSVKKQQSTSLHYHPLGRGGAQGGEFLGNHIRIVNDYTAPTSAIYTGLTMGDMQCDDIGSAPSYIADVGAVYEDDQFEPIPRLTFNKPRHDFRLATVKSRVHPIIDIQGYIDILVRIGANGKLTPFTGEFYPEDSKIKCDYYLDIVHPSGFKEKLQLYVADDVTKNDTYWVLVSERPTGHNLAKRFIKVLPKWEFNPAMLNGDSVSSFMMIKYYFIHREE